MQSDFNDNRGVYIGDRGSDTIIDDNENVQKHKRTKIKRILSFLNKYSNVLIAFCAVATAFATFLIWDVARKQTELTSIMGKASERPVIQIDYISETLGEFTRRNNLGDIAIHSMEIRTIRLTNTGRGSAHKLRIEFRGEKTKEIKEWELAIKRKELELAVGETYEDFISREKIESGEVSPFVKVTYQDIFKNEYITDIFRD